MGYNINTNNPLVIDFDKKYIINTINPHSYIVAKKDDLFKKALLSSDALIPDGSGFMLASKLLKREKLSKLAGADLHCHLLNILNSTSGSVFYMGSSVVVLQNIQKRLLIEFPNICVATYSPPYKSELLNEDSKLIIEKINEFNPDVLFVGMTAPKQEKWLYKNKDKLNFKLASSIGAVFDFYAGTISRPSQFWLDLHLEWLVRLLMEPKRLWKRNFISTPLFLFDIILYKIGWKK